MIPWKHHRVIQSLDSILGDGIEAAFGYALGRNLVNGLAVGILKDGERYIRILGPDIDADSLFEICSSTKTFTAELTSVLAHRGVVDWHKSFGVNLPETLRRTIPESSLKISLSSLASHRSGLPMLPSNLWFENRQNPYGSYSVADLQSYLKNDFPRDPAVGRYNYSNLGFGIIGYALECATGKPYRELLQEELLTPLGLDHTYVALSGIELPALAQGHAETGKPTDRWTQLALAPAGGICSTAGDMLHWMDYMISDPNRDVFQLYGSPDGEQTGLGWGYDRKHRVYERGGMTGGFSCYMGVNKEEQWGVIVLSNRKTRTIVRVLGKNCERALMGEPLLPMRGSYGISKAYLLEYARNNKLTYYLGRKMRAYLTGRSANKR